MASNFESPFVGSLVHAVDRSIENVEATPRDFSPDLNVERTNSNNQPYSRSAVVTNGVFSVSCAEEAAFKRNEVKCGPIGGALKRVFDTAVAFAAFAVLLPMFTMICLAVYVECPGSVLFRQKRIGFNGREFICLKFRTMAVGAERALREHLANNEDARQEWQATHKLKNDPRVTVLGQFLRRSSLDELPQLFNVLAGHMSMVGPRPIVAEEIPLYREHFDDYAKARPGLTGLWQVSGRNTTTYSQRVAYDVEYLRNWSFSRDLRIIVDTVMHVWEGDGAY